MEDNDLSPLEEDCLTEEEIQMAAASLASAEDCLLRGNYGRAFAHYLLVLKLQPEKKPEIKANFSLSLREWGEQLQRNNRIEDLFKCFHQACELFPECDTILNDMGSQLFRMGYIDEAACCFRRALKIYPDFLEARDNLENTCSHLVERWHFRMLNDRKRNEAYRTAIHRAVKDGRDFVLDIGTGTGLLSMFAAEGGAKSVYGCELSKTMYETACDVVGANMMSEHIQLIHKKSTELQVPDDLPARVSLVVTETFDAGLLGEHILTTLQHAWTHLLLAPGMAQVVPGGATVYLCAIEAESIRKQNRLLYPGLQGLDLSEVEIVCNTGGTKGDLEEDNEPYTSERIENLSGGCKIITDPVPVMHFNFNDPEVIDDYIKGYSREMTIPVTSSGRLDALAMWFDLHLDDDQSLTTSPGSNSCWEQAVFPVLRSHMQGKGAPEAYQVRTGDSLVVDCQVKENVLQFKCKNINRKCTPAKTPTSDCNVTFGAAGTSSHGNKNTPSFDIGNKHRQKKKSRKSKSSSSSNQNGNDKTTSNGNNNTNGSLFSNPGLSCPFQIDDLASEGLHFGAVPPGIFQRPLSNIGIQSHLWQSQGNANNGNLSPPLFSLFNLPLSSSATATLNSLENFPMRNSFGGMEPAHFPTLSQVFSPQDGSLVSPLFTPIGGTPPLQTINIPGAAPCSPPPNNLCFVNNNIAPSSATSNSNHSNINNNNHPGDARGLPGYHSPGRNIQHSKSDNHISKHATLNDTTASTSLPNNRTFSLAKREPPKLPTFYLERHDLGKLNDLDYNKAMCNALLSVFSQLGNQNLSVVDTTQGFSVLALQALKLGAEEVCIIRDSSANQDLFYQLIAANEIDLNKVSFAYSNFEECDGVWSVLVADLVEPCGCFRQQVLEDIALARMTCLRPDGIVIPAVVKVYGMAIESDSLLGDSTVVNDDNTLGFLVSAFMKDFQMSNHVDIELSTLDYRKLSHPFELFSYEFNSTEDQVPTYLSQSKKHKVTACDTGQVTAVVYWFDISLTNNIKISTLNPRMHWKQAAVIQKIPVSVSTDSRLLVRGMCKNSCIDIKVSLA